MLTLALTLGAALAQEHGHQDPGHTHDAEEEHRFADVEKWSAVFDDPARDAWQKPAELVATLHIAAGATVADIGAGTGYFEPYLAKAVGPTGHVVAIDVEPTLVDHLAKRATAEGLTQVEARLGKPEDPGLKPAEADVVLLVDTYHHVSDRVAWFGRLKGATRPGGRLVIVDFDPASSDEHGPPRDHRIPADQVLKELDQAGWTLVDRPTLLTAQYVLVLTPKP
ncbi:MAG: methyltransferase domain-containing protein [Alphaproteobacteria bacterium]|nr:methyltransferase domain-containing protein [Alphaproteobacteria bacterium]MCB9697664.1 methyltransferase domain-containing protein [Alphaproteobacteria bacterium]